jgi:hypothetical protein
MRAKFYNLLKLHPLVFVGARKEIRKQNVSEEAVARVEENLP